MLFNVTMNCAEMQRQKLSLAEKLRKNREQKMQRLEKAQEKQRDDFMVQTDQATNAKEVVEVGAKKTST